MKKPMYSAFFALCLLLSPLTYAKIYDCFPFCDEIELLHMRLYELDPHVDYFVLVESVQTQRGNPKPLHFQNNKALFHNYLHKIIHVVVKKGIPKEGDWEREHFQRDCIREGLTKCKDDDLILISDLDEIPRPEAIAELKRLLKENYKKNKGNKHRELKAYALEQDLFYFHLNRKGQWLKWHGTVGVIYADLKKKRPQYFRDLRDKLPYLPNAGWHFTWMGGIEKIRSKFKNVVESSEKERQYTDEDIKNWVNEWAPTVIPLDHTFPRYIQNHETFLRSRGFLADP